ncbi:NaeI family type II restriction endonuclease [Actinoplanes sp. NBRC 103695]|uniref:NaeI family type II restriction endonuclease n=1 Tax=Actinoplanes sp. NBRC 103695 TaxID=3032202 RepID=UPI002554DFE3|nr:NaeI family type II restriction endonuclease [Actinoplanes sp. NBRC 103695]
MDSGAADALFEMPATSAGGRGRPAPPPGETCRNDRGDVHVLDRPEHDSELQAVHGWFEIFGRTPELIGDAVEDAIYYVLDGARTHRFDIRDERVDSDERRSIGTKLQFHVIENFELPRLRHPDTEVAGVGLEIKGTIGGNWAVPKEGQCGVTLLIRLDLERDRHKAWLMRTHRAWLRDGANNDGKRGVLANALRAYAVELYGWEPLRPNPLKMLEPADLDVVFGDAGQQPRLTHLFRTLPQVVIPRAVILTVCANRDDPMRRVRAIRPLVRPFGLELLCGKWPAQRELAEDLGFDLTGAAWVAVPAPDLDGYGPLSEQVRAEVE